MTSLVKNVLGMRQKETSIEIEPREDCACLTSLFLKFIERYFRMYQKYYKSTTVHVSRKSPEKKFPGFIHDSQSSLQSNFRVNLLVVTGRVLSLSFPVMSAGYKPDSLFLRNFPFLSGGVSPFWTLNSEAFSIIWYQESFLNFAEANKGRKPTMGERIRWR